MTKYRMQLAVAMGALFLAACQERPTTPAWSVDPSLDAITLQEGTATVAWNRITRQLVVKHNTGAAPAIRVYALVSIAQYNAAIAAEKAETDPLHPSDAAAVAGASASVLSFLYPDEVGYLEGEVNREQATRGWPGNQSEDFEAGEQLGREVAAGIITRAQGDRFFAPFTGTVPVCPGCWLPVPTPPAFATLGKAQTLFLTSGDQFQPPPPPAFGSSEFIAGLAEVRQIAQTRTAEQDSIARFWALPTGTVSPLGYWNEAASDLIVRYALDERRAARTLALMNGAGFDAIVASHAAKFTHWLIRPTQADPSITLAVGLPSFPSYPSNHAAISAAAATVLGAAFPSERSALDAAAEEAGLSRVFAGIHYRFDSDAGLALGRTIGRYVLEQGGTGHEPLVLR